MSAPGFPSGVPTYFDLETLPSMRASSPKYVLRNWVAESAIRRARASDFPEVAAVLACLRHPYDDHPEYERFATPL